MKTRLQKHYDTLYTDAGHTFGGEKGEPFDLVVESRRYIQSGKVLDIGAGEGRNALFLAVKGFEVEAIDLSKVGLEKLKSKAEKRGLNVKAHAKDITETKITGLYDYILLSFVLHHLSVEEAKALVTQIKEHTNKGGLNVIATFTRHGDIFRHSPSTKLFYPDRGGVKLMYVDWDVLVYKEENRKARKTCPDGSPMFNISALLIARKKY